MSFFMYVIKPKYVIGPGQMPYRELWTLKLTYGTPHAFIDNTLFEVLKGSKPSL